MMVRELSIDVGEGIDQLSGEGGFAQNLLRNWGTDLGRRQGYYTLARPSNHGNTPLIGSINSSDV